MLTMFTTPKPFRGHIGVIQTNAIQSWLLLHPEPEVILIGNEEGTAEVASRFGIRHIAEVECSKYGTPLVNSLFSIAQNTAKYQLMCYVNADIILFSDFLPAVQRVHQYPFLMIGQRWDLELNEAVNFDDTQWESWLRAHVAEHGKLHPKSGIDYFVFSRGLYRDIPLFAIGRGGWDNWLVYQARLLKTPVIDATRAIMAIHQKHDYSHHPEGTAGVWEGPERKHNIELMGGVDHSFGLDYATLRLAGQGLKQALTLRHFYFRMRAMPMLYPRLYFFLTPFRVWEKSLEAVRLMWGRLGSFLFSGLGSIFRAGIDFISIVIYPVAKLLGKNKIRILCYHRVCDLPETKDIMHWLNICPEVFAQQMAFLTQNGFNVITLEQLVSYKEKKTKPPPKTVILTFDDGYRDNYLNAFPILEKYGFKGTFFVVTDYIGSDRIFHWLKLGEKSLAHSRENRPYWLPLSPKEMLEMSARGACFGSHSKTHLYLSDIDEDEAIEELKQSKEYLERLLSKPVRCFAYPFGNFNKSVKGLVKAAGYKMAVTVKAGSNTLRSSPFELRRTVIEAKDSPSRFRRKVEGAYDWWLRLAPLVGSVGQILFQWQRRK